MHKNPVTAGLVEQACAVAVEFGPILWAAEVRRGAAGRVF